MDLSFTRGQVSAVFIAMLTAALVANSGKSTWFTGTQMIGVYMVFAITLYLLPSELPTADVLLARENEVIEREQPIC